MCKADPPDFEVRLRGGRIRQVEVTSANDPDRPLGKDYLGVKHPPVVEVEIVDDDAELEHCIAVGPAALKAACDGKDDARYSGDIDLVVYFTVLLDSSLRRDFALKFFLSACESAKDRFVNVFVMWHEELYSVWCQGEPRLSLWRPRL